MVKYQKGEVSADVINCPSVVRIDQDNMGA